MVGEGVPQVTHSHTKSSGLYKRIHVKTSTDQGLGDASLRITSIADLVLLLQAPWIFQNDRISRGGREEEDKRL